MAVAAYLWGDNVPVVRNMPAPKRAGELKYWYREARKVIPALPAWQDSFHKSADITVETIIFSLEFPLPWKLIISRKSQLH